jgi:hypothetical protein
MSDRELYLAMAQKSLAQFRSSPHDWARFMRDAPDETTSKMLLVFATWAHAGLQSVVLGHKLAAALMATTARGALDESARLPWPAFELQIPAGLLATSYGDVTLAYVSETPEWLPIKRDAHTAGVTVLYHDPATLGHVSLRSVAALADSDSIDDMEQMNGLLSPGRFDADQEQRVRHLLLRLVTGVLLLINTARADKPLAYPDRKARPDKRGLPRPSVHKLEHSVTIDCRQMVYDYVRGVRRSSPSVTTLVRGHWRQQPHGTGRALRRAQWISPFWRGPEGAPTTVHTVKLRTEPTGGDHA